MCAKICNPNYPPFPVQPANKKLSGYYDREIEKTKEVKGKGRRDLFSSGTGKNGRRTSASSNYKSESEEVGNDRNAMGMNGGEEDTSSVTDIDIPLEEPEPEMPKRKIIRVTKPVKLRDFTNEEKGEEENEEEKQQEKDKEKEALKPRGWKTDHDEGKTARQGLQKMKKLGGIHFYSMFYHF